MLSLERVMHVCLNPTFRWGIICHSLAWAIIHGVAMDYSQLPQLANTFISQKNKTLWWKESPIKREGGGVVVEHLSTAISIILSAPFESYTVQASYM